MVSHRLPGPHHLPVDQDGHKRQAAEVLKTKRQELEAARGGFINLPTFDAKRITVGELIDALLTDYEVRERRSIAVARSHLKRIREEVGQVRAVDLKTKHLVEYQVTRRRAKAAGGTINREVSLLRRAVRGFLEEQRLPVPRVTPLPENVREGFFNRAEVAALIQHLPADLHDFVWFGFLTGWRKGEIASLSGPTWMRRPRPSGSRGGRARTNRPVR